MPVKPIINPEPGRFICQGPGAAVNAHCLEEVEVTRGMNVVVISARERTMILGQRHPIERRCQEEIAAADVIIDVIE
jgi:hypothetical protein